MRSAHRTLDMLAVLSQSLVLHEKITVRQRNIVERYCLRARIRQETRFEGDSVVSTEELENPGEWTKKLESQTLVKIDGAPYISHDDLRHELLSRIHVSV